MASRRMHRWALSEDHPEILDDLICGTKKVEGRKMNPAKLSVKHGDGIFMTCSRRAAVFRVRDIRTYGNLTDYLMSEGWKNCLPSAGSYDEAYQTYYEFHGEGVNEPFMAFEFYSR